MPSRLPIYQSLVCWLSLEHWTAPQWLYGAMGVLFLILWGAAIYGLATEEEIDLLKNN